MVMGAGRGEMYETAAREYGRALDRLAWGYEADPERRLDLRQEIHLQLWRSLALYDGRCSLKTWVFRVAHNTAVSYIARERRDRGPLVGLEEVEELSADQAAPDIDRQRALERVSEMVQQLKPLDRQIMISYLEGMEGAEISEVTGLSAANVAMKISRIKRVMAREVEAGRERQRHGG
jgi:RNA polymerase sigma-70 factor, ECF subfamily